MLRTLVNYTLDFLYPGHCPVCDCAILTSQALCPDCWKKLDFIYLEQLGLPILNSYVNEMGLFYAGESTTDQDYKVYSIVTFNEVAKNLVHSLKYEDKTQVAVLMAKLMAMAIRTMQIEVDVILPVPMYPYKLRQRKYNQAALLARFIARGIGAQCQIDGLTKIKNTKSQTTLAFHERLHNNNGAFSLNHARIAAIQGKRIMLVDDVITTGATVYECAKLLQSQAYGPVHIMCFARNV